MSADPVAIHLIVEIVPLCDERPVSWANRLTFGAAPVWIDAKTALMAFNALRSNCVVMYNDTPKKRRKTTRNAA